MTSVLELPNVEAAFNIWLQAEAETARAYSSIPARGATFPLSVAYRLGGVPAEKHAIDAPRIQLEVWGEGGSGGTTKTALWNYARAVWKRALELEGETVELSNGEAVFVSSVRPEIGLQWLPDEPSGRPRYVASLRVYAKPSDRSS